MRLPGDRITRTPGINNHRLFACPAQHQRSIKPGRPSSDNDYIRNFICGIDILQVLHL